MPDYVVIGHVTKDLAPDGSFHIGGTATYAAQCADCLGLRVGVVTSTEPDLPLFADAAAIKVHCHTAQHTTTFENVYTAGQRRQRIYMVADSLTQCDIPQGWEDAPIVHLAPVAREVTPTVAEVFPHAFLGVTPQGWLRSWDGQGRVSFCEWDEAKQVLATADAVVLSLEDLGGRRDVLESYVRMGHILVLTVGKEGAIVYCRGQEERVPAFDVVERDPTGAGDVFAAAYFIRLHETGDAIESARYANCAASFVVETGGTTHLPSREEIAWRMTHGHVRRQN
ncbi:MAG: hypothetical protein A2Y73_05605 [Chloroflexi bacterium RBG_13_56_8]|nr:MAG: hypothetical protein A2Y73_05605 [Chloroflexi bacterium RBG_13_56_8]